VKFIPFLTLCALTFGILTLPSHAFPSQVAAKTPAVDIRNICGLALRAYSPNENDFISWSFTAMQFLRKVANAVRFGLGDGDTAVKIKSRAAIVKLNILLDRGRLEEAQNIPVDGATQDLKKVFADFEVSAITILDSMMKIGILQQLYEKHSGDQSKQTEIDKLIDSEIAIVDEAAKDFGKNYYFYTDFRKFLKYRIRQDATTIKRYGKDYVKTARELYFTVGVADPVAQLQTYRNQTEFQEKLKQLGVQDAELAEFKLLDWQKISTRIRDDGDILGLDTLKALSVVPALQLEILDFASTKQWGRLFKYGASMPLIGAAITKGVRMIPWFGSQLADSVAMKKIFLSYTNFQAYTQHFHPLAMLVTDHGEALSKLRTLENLCSASKDPDILVTLYRRNDLSDLRDEILETAKKGSGNANDADEFKTFLDQMAAAQQTATSLGFIDANYSPAPFQIGLQMGYVTSVILLAHHFGWNPVTVLALFGGSAVVTAGGSAAAATFWKPAAK